MTQINWYKHYSKLSKTIGQFVICTVIDTGYIKYRGENVQFMRVLPLSYKYQKIKLTSKIFVFPSKYESVVHLKKDELVKICIGHYQLIAKSDYILPNINFQECRSYSLNNNIWDTYTCVKIKRNQVHKQLHLYLHNDDNQENQEVKEEQEVRDLNSKKLPTSLSYPLNWDNVIFQNGYIVVCSPYSDYGGKGKRFKWKVSSSDFEKIKLLLAKKIPHVNIKIVAGNVAEVLNFDEIISSIISLTKPVSGPTRVYVKKEEIIVTNKPHELNVNDFRNISEVKSSAYLKLLCKIHLEKFPVYYCIETKNTKHGNARPEKAFIFFIKATKSQLLLIYENTLESRSSYLFIINRAKYQKTILEIHQFFASDYENKREKMAYGKVVFSENVYSYYRIFHDSFHQWKYDLLQEIENM